MIGCGWDEIHVTRCNERIERYVLTTKRLRSFFFFSNDPFDRGSRDCSICKYIGRKTLTLSFEGVCCVWERQREKRPGRGWDRHFPSSGAGKATGLDRMLLFGSLAVYRNGMVFVLPEIHHQIRHVSQSLFDIFLYGTTSRQVVGTIRTLVSFDHSLGRHHQDGDYPTFPPYW